MYFKNNRERNVDHQSFFLRLEGFTLSSIHVRFFWTSCLPSDEPDLLFNYAEHLIQGIISYALVRNLPIEFHNVLCDTNNYIFDLKCRTDDLSLRSFLKYTLVHPSISFCSHVDLIVNLIEPPSQLYI